MNKSAGSLVPLDMATAVATRPLWADELPFRPESMDESLWNLVERHRVGLAFLIIFCTAVALIAALLSPPVYRAVAQVEFQTPVGGAIVDSGSTDEFSLKRFEQTQVELVRSRALAEKVAESIKLTTTPPLIEALGGNAEGGPLLKPAAVDLLRSGVSVEMIGGSGLAAVRFDSHDPAVSAYVANSYAVNLTSLSVQRQHSASTASQDFLTRRLGEVKSDLETSERALIDYTRQSGLIDPSAGTSSVSGQTSPHSLASEKLGQMNQAYSLARAQRIEADQRWSTAQRTPLMSLPEVLSNPTIQQLSQRSAVAQATLQQERQRRTDQHPSVQQAIAEIVEINRQIETVASNIRNSIRERAEVTRRQEGALAGTVRQLEGQSLADQSKGVQYNVLKREADTQRQVYRSLLENLSKISVASALPANTVALLDRAAIPSEPIAPRPALSAALGAGAGLFLSLLYLFGIRMLDDKVHSPDDLDPDLRLPLLAALPRVEDPLEALEDPGSSFSEANFSLCAALEQRCSRDERRTILFTSSGEGEGKTTTAFAVARNFAAAGKRVLLLDADMRRPGMHRYFEVESVAGLSTVLAKLCPAREAVGETSVPNLFLLPSGPVPPSAAALLAGNRFGTVLNQLSRSFSMVIIDAPPVFGLADTPRLAAAANSVVFVVEADRTKLGNVRNSLRRLIDANANLVGAVLTKMDISGRVSSAYIYEYRSQKARELATCDEAER